jgi:hypothetical protein
MDFKKCPPGQDKKLGNGKKNPPWWGQGYNMEVPGPSCQDEDARCSNHWAEEFNVVLGIADLHIGDVVMGVNHHVDDPKVDVICGASSSSCHEEDEGREKGLVTIIHASSGSQRAVFKKDWWRPCSRLRHLTHECRCCSGCCWHKMC